MGVLDSNKFLPQAKKIEITNKVCTAGGYVTSGLIDVKDYTAAVFYINGSGFAEGDSMNIKAWLNARNNGNNNMSADIVRLTNNIVLSEISANGCYIVDTRKASKFGLTTTTAGTFSAEIYLVSKNENVSTDILLEKIRALVNTTSGNVSGINTNVNTIAGKSTSIDGSTKSLDGVYSETEGSFILNGTTGTKLTKGITKEYSTLAIDVVLSDANPLKISGTLKKGSSVVLPDITFRAASGELCSQITATGLYYVDVRGASTILLAQNASGTSASGTVTYRLLKEEPVDYKPIQEIATVDKTFTGGETSAEIGFTSQNKAIKYFKFVKAEIKYTGINAPAATISVAPYYGSSVWGASKEIYTINGKKDSIDWFMSPGTQFTFWFTFRGGFTPADGDVLSVKLFGMR